MIGVFMIWIGLTGGLASGKSTVAAILRKRHIPVIGADDLARIAVEKGSVGLTQVVSHFGPDILDANDQLDRKKLATKVFSQKSSLLALEQIIHPIVQRLTQEARTQLTQQGEKIAFYDVPLLFEKNMEKLFDKVVVVTTSEENQVRRAIFRDKSNEKDVKSRLAFQIALTEKVQRADYIIENNADLKSLEKKVDVMLNWLKLYQPHE